MDKYGTGSASYEAAGEREGIAKLVDAFYRYMDERHEASTIRAMHAPDLSLSREKLKVFLCAWLGGPNEYAKTFGPISIPRVHAHLSIDVAERDAWLGCMSAAVEQQPWRPEFKAYFMGAIALPAERVRATSVARRAADQTGHATPR